MSRPLPPAERREARQGALIVIGLLLFLFEAFLPKPLPWMKFGLANIATLIALYWMGFRAAFTVAFFRILIGAVFTGTMFTPGFLLSLSGGFLALAAMGVLHRLRIFGIVSVSVAGALAHNAGQLLVAAYLLFANNMVLYIAPYLLASGVFTGVVIGYLSWRVLQRLEREDGVGGENPGG
ncbi:MAG TPA: Gx transporter family protein [Calditrichia bacterium]|nr:Gx transporter family protein [Calditrichota bacterium]HQU71568.1 Gx transporter family protein [Calditrichia bacterium]HQV34109.1 Gx transporter family protein [Calditrichia bacterium]